MELQNGLGGHYLTTINTLGAEVVLGHEHLEQALDPEVTEGNQGEWPLQRLMNFANHFDDKVYRLLAAEVDMPLEVQSATVTSHLERSVLAYRDRWYGPMEELSPVAAKIFDQIFRVDMPSAATNALGLFRHSTATLTSLSIDWCLTTPPNLRTEWSDYEQWIRWYVDLFSLRFPHLRAFQYRNAVVKETIIPPGLFLFDQSSIFTENGES